MSATCQAQRAYWDRRRKMRRSRPCGRRGVVAVRYLIGKRLERVVFCDQCQAAGDPLRDALATARQVIELGEGAAPNRVLGLADTTPPP